MFWRLLMESFRRQRRRKMLAGLAILLGTTAVTAMLALATTIGDRIHKELAVYGANIVVYPKADLLDVKVGGVNVKPATGGAYLKESDLEKLKGIFWANNITGVSPELLLEQLMSLSGHRRSRSSLFRVPLLGLWFDHDFGELQDRCYPAASLVEARGAVATADVPRRTGDWPVLSSERQAWRSKLDLTDRIR